MLEQDRRKFIGWGLFGVTIFMLLISGGCALYVINSPNPECKIINFAGEKCGTRSGAIFMNILYETDIGSAFSECDLSHCNKIQIWPGCSLYPQCKHGCDKARSLHSGETKYCRYYGYNDKETYMLTDSSLSESGEIAIGLSVAALLILLIVFGILIYKSVY